MAKKDNSLEVSFYGFVGLFVFSLIPGYFLGILFFSDISSRILFAIPFAFVLAIVLFIYSKKRLKKMARMEEEKAALLTRKNPVKTPTYTPPKPTPKPAPTAAPDKPLKQFIQASLTGYYLAYRYDNKGVAMADTLVEDFDALVPGDPLDFIQEPDNPYDSSAVAILHKDKKIGYVYRGQTQDMVNDFLRRGEPIRAFVQSSANRAVTYEIGFYKPGEAPASSKSAAEAAVDAILNPTAGLKRLASGRLTTSGSQDAQDNILLCSEGDEVSVFYDFDRGKYEVHAHDYIGCLPAKLEDLAEEARFFITEIDYTESDKAYVVVAAYEESDS